MRSAVGMAFAVVLVGCQTGPQFTAFKPGTTQAQRQQAFDECKIAALRDVPQSISTSVSPGYYNPGTLSCNTFGTTTTCNRVGAVNIPGSVSQSDDNAGLRDRVIMRCMQAKGYTLLENIPVCQNEAERRNAMVNPQPGSASQLKCSSGVALDR